MGVTKVANRRFRARYSEHGIRYNVGTYNTYREAEEAIKSHKARGNQDYTEIPIQNFQHRPAKPTLKERVKSKWQSVRESLEKRNLL